MARGEHFIRMEGQETYRFATKTLASTALAAIERAGLRPDQIDLFIPHQANIRIIEAVAKGLGLPMERIFVNLDRYGNTSAASVPLALAEAVDAGRIRQGDNVVFVAFGAGFTSGAVAFEWTADPAAGARAAADPARRRSASASPSTGIRWTPSRPSSPPSWPAPARWTSPSTTWSRATRRPGRPAPEAPAVAPAGAGRA